MISVSIDLPVSLDHMSENINENNVQVQGVADSPGALELRAELIAALSRRFLARTIKLIFGPQVSQFPPLWRILRRLFSLYKCRRCPRPAELRVPCLVSETNCGC